MMAVALSMNDYASIEMSHKFQTIDDATSSVQAGYYMSRVDQSKIKVNQPTDLLV